MQNLNLFGINKINSEKIFQHHARYDNDFDEKLHKAIIEAKNELKLKEENLKLLKEILDKVEKIVFQEPFVLSRNLQEVFSEIGNGEVAIKIGGYKSVEIYISKYANEYRNDFFINTYYKKGYFSVKLFRASYFIPTNEASHLKEPEKKVEFYQEVTKKDIQKIIEIINQSKKIKVEIEKH
jgi:hypothetical protein